MSKRILTTGAVAWQDRKEDQLLLDPASLV